MGRITVASKTSNASPSSLHPPYLEMICEAISALKERTGSSQPAIAKYIESNYNKALPANFKTLLSVQLKKFVKSEKLVKVKNSFKVSSTEKLKLDIKEIQKSKRTAAKSSGSTPKKKAAEKVPLKGGKTKRLSQVKTPDALKKSTKNNVKSGSKSKVTKMARN